MTEIMEQQAALTVSIVAPDGLPNLEAHVYAYPETTDEFFAVVYAVGGPGAFRPRYDPATEYTIASLADGHSLFLHEPQSKKGKAVARVRPFLATFDQTVLAVRKAS